MIKYLIIFLAVAFFLSGCASSPQTSSVYPRKSSRDSDRKSGPAMMLYEQAEKDLDVNDSVIVIPPSEVKKRSAAD